MHLDEPNWIIDEFNEFLLVLLSQLAFSEFREAVIKKKKSKCKLFPKRGDPKVYVFEILNFGKFQVSKLASGMKRLFKVSFKN